MILRRITGHVKAQNWFAVGIDFLIVVLGVLLAMQISNWNDSRKDSQLERAYLARLSSDMKATIAKLSKAEDSSEARRSASAAMVTAASDSSTSDEKLIEATDRFFAEAWHTPYFQPADSTFKDLSSTGNLQLIRNTGLRDAVITLYESYDDVAAGFEINQNWVLPNDSRIMYEHDFLQLDRRFDGIYSRAEGDAKNEMYRSLQAELGRVAAGYYWIFSSAVRDFRKATDETITVQQLIEAELDD